MKRPTLTVLVAGLLSLLLALPAQSAPQVAADVAPIHSLVARVMEGVGDPDLVIQRGASPHDYSMRPSEAAALDQADVVFWTSAQLTPWLDRSLENLAGNATRVELIEAPGTTRHEFRETFLDTQESHDAHEHKDEHGHNEGHDEVVDTHESDGGHDHTHEGVDPHAWLDPENAQNWLGVIADTLAKEDPDNAEQYQQNAETGISEIDELTTRIEDAVAPVSDVAFIVFHDAYQYFERRFGVTALGSISLSDATDPSSSRIAAIREIVRDNEVRCVFAEPQFNPGLVETVLDGTEADTGVLDPLGSDIPAGADFYPALMETLTDNLVDCLSSE